MPDFTWKQGDTGPPVEDTLGLGSQPVPTDGATLTARLRSLTSDALTALTGVAAFTNEGGGVRFTPSEADTSQPVGNYIFEWVVTFPTGQVLTFPTDGYLWGRIEPTAASAPRLMLSVEDVKQHLNLSNPDRARDSRLLGYVGVVTPLIEAQVGPVTVRRFEEWHDGGSNVIALHRAPSSGFGATPTLQLLAASEYRGPIEYPLSIVPSPAFGSIYSVMLNRGTASITRRTAGGRTLAFMPGREAVHVIYEAGLATVPENVKFAAAECVRICYEWTRQVGRGSQAYADTQEIGPALTAELTRIIRMMLAPHRRYPAIA